MLNELLSLRATSDFLGSLSEPELRDLARELDEVRCQANQALIRAGDVGNQLYVVLSGRLEVSIGRRDDQQALGEIGPGDVTGEVSLLIGGERTATVRALTACRLACLSRDGFANLLARYPETSRRISVLVLERLRLSHLAPHLIRTFGPLDLEALRELEAEIEWLTLKSGQDLFHQGDPADAGYIVVNGRLRAAVDSPDGGEQVLGEMGPGEMVGEMALLTEGTRAATVYAVRDASLARLPSRGFSRLIDRYPRAMLPISRTIVDRLVRQRSTDSLAKATAHTIALVPADPGVPVAAVARRLARSLASHGSVVHLTSRVVDEALAKADIAQISHTGAHHIRLSQWLNEREATFRFVVYQAQPRWTPWTDCCVRHADHLLIVADASSDPTPGEMEEHLAGRWPRARAPRRSLVLLQPKAEPTATSRWLRDREVEQHFHLRPDSGADFARLARSLTGNAVGLVLGGGGARGFAHIGVIKALEELGVPIDLVGGTSMGAIVAGLCAQRLSSAEIRRQCAEYAGARLDFTFPAVALLAGHRIHRQFQALFGERKIEDLQIPFFAVSTNLTRAEQVVHTRESLLAAIRASMSLPGIFPPAQQDGDLLVDGGLINNLPVDVMREQGGGSVIAVDVSQKVDLSGDPRLTTELSGWKVLRSRLNPLAETIPVPGILAVLSRVTEISSRAALNRTQGLADLYLQLPLGEWKLLELEAIEAIAERGYQLAIEPLRTWRDRGTKKT